MKLMPDYDEFIMQEKRALKMKNEKLKKNAIRLKDEKFQERFEMFSSLINDVHKIYWEADCDCKLEIKKGGSGQPGVYFKTTSDDTISEAMKYYLGDWKIKLFYFQNGREEIEKISYPDAIRRLKTWKEAGLIMLTEKIELDNVLAKFSKIGITEKDIEILSKNGRKLVKDLI